MAASERKSFLLRIDPEVWKELEAWAAQELRSVNGQVEFILRESIERRRKGPAAATAGTARGRR
jgi:hypothetical protein